MSQTKFSTVRIRSRDTNGGPSGANTVVELDGVPLKTVTFVKVQCGAKKLTKVMIEMIAHVDVEVSAEVIGSFSKVKIDPDQI